MFALSSGNEKLSIKNIILITARPRLCSWASQVGPEVSGWQDVFGVVHRPWEAVSTHLKVDIHDLAFSPRRCGASLLPCFSPQAGLQRFLRGLLSLGKAGAGQMGQISV